MKISQSTQSSAKFICRICQNERDNKEYIAKEMMFGYEDRFKYFQCSSCGCLQIECYPENMSRYYPSKYYSFKASETSHSVESKSFLSGIKKYLGRKRDQYESFNYGIIGAILHKIRPNHDLVELLRTYFPSDGPLSLGLDENSRMLDVGCGSGRLLQKLHKVGFNCLLGVDAYLEKDIKLDDRLRIIKNTIHGIEGNFDCIMFHHSFEHIKDPLETLQKVKELLSPNGICLIRIPTVSSYAWEHYKLNWVQLDAPRHYFLYSIDSLYCLASKASLKIERIIYDSIGFQFWGSELYKKNIPLSPFFQKIKNINTYFSQEELLEFKKEAQLLNHDSRGDQVAIYLRK